MPVSGFVCAPGADVWGTFASAREKSPKAWISRRLVWHVRCPVVGMAKYRNTEEMTAPAEPPQGATPEMTGDTTASSPERERLAARAYELYLERGGTDGQDMEDWLRAERELRQDSTSRSDE